MVLAFLVLLAFDHIYHIRDHTDGVIKRTALAPASSYTNTHILTLTQMIIITNLCQAKTVRDYICKLRLLLYLYIK